MTAYSYDPEGRYIGPYSCQLDPLETARTGRPVYLLPAEATWTEPPEYDPETEIAVWDGGAWTVKALPEEPEPEPEAEPEPTANELMDILLGVTSNG